MVIIIVGPDGSGKSTLASKISEQTGFTVAHQTRPKNNYEKHHMVDMYKELISSRPNIILDRAWYCEMVYGEIMRDASYINIDQMYELEKYVVSHGYGVIIHCTGSTDTLWQRCVARGEDYIKDKEMLDAINKSYDLILYSMKHKLPIARYDIDEDLS